MTDIDVQQLLSDFAERAFNEQSKAWTNFRIADRTSRELQSKIISKIHKVEIILDRGH